MLKCDEYINLIIPRGGNNLVKFIKNNTKIPVLGHASGICHIFVDESAQFSMALEIIDNAKTQRIGVCNACESLVVHRKIAREFLPLLKEALGKKQVEIRADKEACKLCQNFSLLQRRTGERSIWIISSR